MLQAGRSSLEFSTSVNLSNTRRAEDGEAWYPDASLRTASQGSKQRQSVPNVSVLQQSAHVVEDAIVVCTMVQNEMAYLPEWILHHSALGVEKFLVYDDNSSDGVHSLGRLFEPLNIEVQVLQTIGKRNGTAQAQSFTDCVERNRNAAWVGVFDVDEFVVINNNSCDLRCLLRAIPESSHQVRFNELRFSSAGQINDFGIHLRPAGSIGSVEFSSERLAKVDWEGLATSLSNESRTQELDCTRMDVSEMVLTVGAGQPCLELGARNSDGKFPSIAQQHLWRMPWSNTNKIRDAHQKDLNCKNQTVSKVADWPVCGGGPGKAFVRPKQCDNYLVHKCSEELPETALSFEVAQLSHYVLRSKQNVCRHAIKWRKPNPIIMYQTVDTTFFHLEYDDSASKVAGSDVIQDGLAKLECKDVNK